MALAGAAGHAVAGSRTLREITLHGSTFRLSHRLDNRPLVGEIGHGMAVMHDR